MAMVTEELPGGITKSNPGWQVGYRRRGRCGFADERNCRKPESGAGGFAKRFFPRDPWACGRLWRQRARSRAAAAESFCLDRMNLSKKF